MADDRRRPAASSLRENGEGVRNLGENLRRKMNLSKVIVTFLVFVVAGTLVAAQEKAEPEFKLIEFHMALLKLGPKASETDTDEGKKVHLAASVDEVSSFKFRVSSSSNGAES